MIPNYDIGPEPEAISPEILGLLTRCETATIGHWRLWGFCAPAIRPILPRKRVAGTAVTLALPGPCSTLLHYAMDRIRPGDILLIDRLGDRRHACWGGGVTCAFKAAGGVAAVIDGACTDEAEIAQSDLPVWCRGVSAVTTRQYGLGGRLNRPISVGGAVVQPGDAVLCDSSGVLVLPPDEAESEARRALAFQEQGKAVEAGLARGDSLPELSGATARVEEALRAAAREKAALSGGPR
ncbi:4-hydroxy-4-methyl-2-oxoglutarate aldolase [Novosphingobium sp. PC22D]|uniref:RraA family protein n=1 Tax=Novosphingobium sp. PC22D TaxID=1962403 RepID=UPI000BF03A67|nr:4-hydroxy-4-methyl-2-oxoglutarate aldolase [Novosphingobium sp. PC22D]PEQ14669.1 4-hydroxy-4-methyl-2-oxoglutarate aldolase [Novosphingobium sp. PC22D]